MLISNAYAQAAGAADPTGGLMGLLPLILMFVVLWFLMIRPQMKRAKEHKAMVAAFNSLPVEYLFVADTGSVHQAMRLIIDSEFRKEAH